MNAFEAFQRQAGGTKSRLNGLPSVPSTRPPPPPEEINFEEKGWTCSQCTLINSVTVQECAVCMAPKPKESIVTSDDWEEIDRVLQIISLTSTANQYTLVLRRRIRLCELQTIELKVDSIKREKKEMSASFLQKMKASSFALKKAKDSINPAASSASEAILSLQTAVRASASMSSRKRELKVPNPHSSFRNGGILLNEALKAYDSWRQNLWPKTIEVEDSLCRRKERTRNGANDNFTQAEAHKYITEIFTTISKGLQIMDTLVRSTKFSLTKLEELLSESEMKGNEKNLRQNNFENKRIGVDRLRSIHSTKDEKESRSEKKKAVSEVTKHVGKKPKDVLQMLLNEGPRVRAPTSPPLRKERKKSRSKEKKVHNIMVDDAPTDSFEGDPIRDHDPEKPPAGCYTIIVWDREKFIKEFQLDKDLAVAKIIDESKHIDHPFVVLPGDTLRSIDG
eukprot:CAMPEP_0167766982 /NCGR_PEP_ID=MMETSP0110_2-20121227/15730_1 /TAXON_ID=629695 /ORGANISM="Gymnochlora sp., Strain CCMP2014" /LENGTH=450 /DNA_ID=CAMNT_0007655237 /DNA_START=248 /DNA_END=1596 /DNA_ORIENTATION=+